MERKEMTIFCDGSCFWKIRKGGIGVYMICEGEEIFISKGYENTTISRCEMRAFLEAIRSIKKDVPTTAIVYSDSQYVVNGLTKYLIEWADNNYKGCANADLWKEIVKELNEHRKLRVKVNWTPGHGKDLSNPIVYGNAIADLLADYKNFTEYELDKYEEV